MDCARASELMLEFVEGTLPPDVSEELRIHVESCQRCMRELEAQSSRTRALQALGQAHEKAPDELAQEISESIRKTRSTWYFVRRYWIPAGIFAVVLAVVIVAILFVTGVL